MRPNMPVLQNASAEMASLPTSTAWRDPQVPMRAANGEGIGAARHLPGHGDWHNHLMDCLVIRTQAH